MLFSKLQLNAFYGGPLENQLDEGQPSFNVLNEMINEMENSNLPYAGPYGH